jgi:hypothetical protein
MIHLKIFESFPFEPLKTYEKGDYVVLNFDEIEKENNRNNYIYRKFPDVFAKVLIFNKNQAYPYLIQFTDKSTRSVKGTEILSLANPEEIEDFKLKEEGDKYNL